MYYSVLSATTGSFFAALLEGMIPAISVSSILISTSMAATYIGSLALRFSIPVTECSIALIGIHRMYVTITPSIPDVNPMITVSALNMLETFLFEAPIARRIPISFVLSCTDIRVITPIMIDETIRDTATKAIST